MVAEMLQKLKFLLYVLSLYIFIICFILYIHVI